MVKLEKNLDNILYMCDSSIDGDIIAKNVNNIKKLLKISDENDE